MRTQWMLKWKDIHLEENLLTVKQRERQLLDQPPLTLNKKKHPNKPTHKESTGDNKTIASMFDAMKRKLTPDKEADTTRNNQKVQRNEDNYKS